MSQKQLGFNKTLEQLINENHHLAAALHFLGIQFEHYTEFTLSEICQKKGIALDFVEQKIKDFLTSNYNEVKFDSLSVDLIIEYLKHAHYIFIKQRLPFIVDIVKKFDGDFPEIKNELKLVFPLFVEDFVSHIYEEEDTLFNYIQLMHKSLEDVSLINKVQAKMMENSIKQFQSEHEIHDDHLKGLRNLTNEFEIKPAYDLGTKVVLAELKKLDEELRYHAKIENNILFPRALELERSVLARVRSKIALN
ncbi:MAG: iron-sulfur cluster repair di-iron protein [Bacteroidetes bacterium]|nr:MAG: iron-sulfur cluster repair di-iron protein [Bacteroidota bacterium]